MIFKTMKKEDILKALEGHKDVLSEAKKQNDLFFSKLSCISCGGDVIPFVNPRKLFKENEILPNFLARCKQCNCEFEPYTGIQLNNPR